MKKTTILIMLLLLTGCSIEYNVDINDNIVEETITGYVTDKEIGDGSKGTGLNIYYDLLYKEQHALIFGDDLYTKNISEKGKKIYYNFEYAYENNYKDSMIINSCYENVLFTEDDNFYYINLGGEFSCMYADKINVSVFSYNTIIDSNADKISDDKYIWTIENENDADINLTISKTLKKENYSNSSKGKGMKTFRIVSFIILIILSAVVYLLYRKTNSDSI